MSVAMETGAGDGWAGHGVVFPEVNSHHEDLEVWVEHTGRQHGGVEYSLWWRGKHNMV